MDTSESLPTELRPREFWVALFCSLLLGVIAVGRPAWDGDWIYLATDTASVQAPWHATAAPQNTELSDSGVAFYPHYRLVSRRWLAGELPLWNPDLYAGVPLLANPQWGVLDPQVAVLVLLDAVGGKQLFDRGFAWLAILRLAAAALGTYLLARRLALGSGAAALAAAGYALSGSVVLWLGYSLSHVTPCLPWVLLGIEGLRRGTRLLRSWLTACIAMALAIYGGHPEVAFFVGLCAGLWSLTLLSGDVRRLGLAFLALLTGVLLAAPVLVPFVEYLANSGALLAHRMAPSQRRIPDMMSLGVLVFFMGGLFRWRTWVAGRSSDRSPLGPALMMGLALAGLVLFLRSRGAQLNLGLNGVRSIESGSTWLAFPILALALSAMVDPSANDRKQQRLVIFGALTLALAAAVPGVVDLWRWLPLVGLAAPARLACCAALFMCLLAGQGLQKTGRAGRWAVVCGMGLMLAARIVGQMGETFTAQTIPLDTSDSVVVYDELPDANSPTGASRLSGVIRGGLRPDRVTLHFDQVDEQAVTLSVLGFVDFAVLDEVGPSGEQSFEFNDLALGGLGAGSWRLRLQFERDGEVLGERTPCLLFFPAGAPLNGWALGSAAVALIGLLLTSKRMAGGLFTLLVLGQGFSLVHEWNPSVPMEEHLFESETERFLAEHYPGERFVAEPGILPASTALLGGLTTIDGYDAMDVASFDGYRAYAMKPGRNPLLYWNADGMDLENPAFRLFGVRLLLAHSPRKQPGWTLVAGPKDAPVRTEVFIYSADDPLPRAFCVPHVRDLAGVLADPASFDPAREAFLDGALTVAIQNPFVEGQVREIRRSPERLEFAVELDGEGMFVSTEQHFPGWKLWVDEVQTPILRVNSIFRGVYLGPGRHRLRFEYQPVSWQRGTLLGVLGLLGLLAGAWGARRFRASAQASQTEPHDTIGGKMWGDDPSQAGSPEAP